MKNYFNGPLVLIFMSTVMTDLTRAVLESPSVEPLYQKKMNFDLIICEMIDTEALIGFGQHFTAPVIAVSTSGSNKWTNELVGTPQPSSYVPNLLLSFTDHMTTIQRMGNFLMGIWEDIFMYIIHTPKQVMYTE